MILQRSSPSLPADLLHSHILPEILSDHLHRLLVAPKAPEWHAFYVLPQVSFAFRSSCHALCIRIFGLVEGEGGKVIDDILNFAQTLWTRAKRPPERAHPVPEYTFLQLMSSKSLIQVYMCTALARSFLNLDVLWHIELEARVSELTEGERDNTDVDGDWGGLDVVAPSRRFKMRDDTMHRVYLPLTCALKLCDAIRPERLAYVAADHLAGIVPLYSTAPVMLKYTQDLETYVAREPRVEIEMWITWTMQTLGLIEDTKHLLQQMQGMGKMVKSFKRPTEIPAQVLHETNIINVLHDVVGADWGDHSEKIRERAIDLLEEWTPVDLPF